VSPLTAALKSRYSIADEVSGVVVTQVARGSKAAQGGLPVGTVISRAFSRPVNTPQELKAAIDAARAAGRPSVLLQVTAQGTTALIALELSKGE
jgi:serine protease Do